MRMQLTKHHGWGNDFLVVGAADVAAVGDLAALSRRLCDRRRGIGADGLLIMGDAPNVTATMVLYNADGSIAEMSGNGIRCFAQAVARRDGTYGEQSILTGAGLRAVTIHAGEHPDLAEASVDMGEISPIGEPQGWASIGAHPDRPVAHLSVGNPHTVVGVDDVRAVDLLELGRKVPGTNLEIIEPGPDSTSITMRVHERGAGITEACGTGACASAWAAATWGLVPSNTSEVTVHMDGGSARVRLHQPSDGRVTLVGPAIFIGAIDLSISDLGAGSAAL